jgi:hypothetical protein
MPEKGEEMKHYEKKYAHESILLKPFTMRMVM